MIKEGSLIDGKYRVLKEIGRGGMSVVYMALNEKANKTWAIKEVRKDGVLDFNSVRQGLIVETEMLKNLKHTHLPSIIDVIDQDDMFLIVMDYIEGVSLGKALKEYGIQSQEVVIDWAKQLCDVLGYLHTRPQPIIYRDMKPDNVMLKPDGDLMLIDFGTARQFKEKNVEDTTCLGTIGYAAPEQFGGQGQTDGRTDIYCLGATLYHLVTGYSPCEPPYEMLPIRSINPALSAGLERIILKCTQKDPSQRYQSCAELMYDLEHYEEIDDQFIGTQKRKFGAFLTVLIMFVVFGIAGVLFGVMANQMSVDTYDTKIASASKETNELEKTNLYKECIALPGKAGDIKAYIGLIEAFREDSVYTNEEHATISKLFNENKEELVKNQSDYATLCFEIGKSIWYYSDYGDKTTRMVNSIVWFSDARDNGYSDEKKTGMINAYIEIGMFYRDIENNATEGEDGGSYKILFNNLRDMIETIAKDEAESDIVRMELLSVARLAIHKYSTKFKGDGVAYEELSKMVDNIKSIATSIDTEVDVIVEIKGDILHFVGDTSNAVDSAYGTKGVGN